MNSPTFRERCAWSAGQDAALAYMVQRIVVPCPYALDTPEFTAWGLGLESELRDHDEIVHAYTTH